MDYWETTSIDSSEIVQAAGSILTRAIHSWNTLMLLSPFRASWNKAIVVYLYLILIIAVV